jgi:hypothetical protein
MESDFSDLERHGKFFFAGEAKDGSAICWFIGPRHVSPETPEEKEKETRFIVYMIEKARKAG